MLIDRIEFYMDCDNCPYDDCYTGKCKYEWYCTFFKVAHRFTTMIYTEGE